METITINLAEKRVLGNLFYCLVLSYLRSVSVDGKVIVTNKSVADFFGVTPRYITKAIGELRRNGYLTEFHYNGKLRTITIA